MSETVHTQLQALLGSEMHKKHTHAILLGVKSRDGQVEFAGAEGSAMPQSPYFIASVTKMYTVAVLMQLVDEKRLDLDTPLTTYLPLDLIAGIHVYDGVDYSPQLKVYQLIHQTSGLADYFEDKRPDGGSLVGDFKQGKDRAYTVADVLAMVRDMTPKFAPDANEGRKSHYSDTNYQLLGAIIEAITGQSLADNFQARLFDHLGLAQTYLYDHQAAANREQPLPFYHHDAVMNIPLALSSEGPAGGIVSTLPDGLRFLRAYFDGELFDKGHFMRMMGQWNRLFFPMQYGYGLMRFQLPRPMTLFRYSPELIGHSGASGSFAFYALREELFIAGTFNQIDNPSRPFRFMLRVIDAVT